MAWAMRPARMPLVFRDIPLVHWSGTHVIYKLKIINMIRFCDVLIPSSGGGDKHGSPSNLLILSKFRKKACSAAGRKSVSAGTDGMCDIERFNVFLHDCKDRPEITSNKIYVQEINNIEKLA